MTHPRLKIILELPGGEPITTDLELQVPLADLPAAVAVGGRESLERILESLVAEAKA